MIPVLTPEEMAAVDRGASQPEEVLIGRAGAGVARAVGRLLDRTYGARVVVVAGKGNNGNDGRVAARLLAARGAAVSVINAGDVGAGARLPPADVVIDAAYGTGLQRPYHPPDPGDAPVVAVDIPSGVSGLTGSLAGGEAMAATATVTFASWKPGLLLGDGPAHAGAVEVVDIGLDRPVVDAARCWLVEDADAAWLPPRPRDGHKWQSAVAVVAGSPGMTGAPWMVSRGALRAGAGYVRLSMPGVDLTTSPLPPSEVVAVPMPADGWDEAARSGLERVRALVLGPGLGPVTEGGARGPVARLLAAAPQPAVVDADGLNALGSLDAVAQVVAARSHPTVITPHAGEYARLAGGPPGEDRLAAVRHAARRSGAVVLLKGSTTVVAHPDGRVLLAAAGSARLATAGSGDVLSGIIGAFLAQGVPAWEAAGLAAHVHGRASGLGLAVGLTALDLPDLVARWLSEVLP
jgi:hydroxyethylthiazole kinase-like uncharacterized protein yjeF